MFAAWFEPFSPSLCRLLELLTLLCWGSLCMSTAKSLPDASFHFISQMSNLMNQARLKVLKARDDMITVSKSFFRLTSCANQRCHNQSADWVVTGLEFILAMDCISKMNSNFESCTFSGLIATDNELNNNRSYIFIPLYILVPGSCLL